MIAPTTRPTIANKEFEMTYTTYPLATAPSNRSTMIRRTFNAEWIKLVSLRSTWRSVGASMVLAIGLGSAIVAAQVAQWSSMTATDRQQFDPTSRSLIGLLFVAVVMGALAVRSVTSEYSTGMIRTTFTALPARRSMLKAKAAAAAALAFPVALVSNVLGFEIGQQLLASKHVQVSLGNPSALRAVVLGAAAVSVVTVIGVGLGGLIRRTAPATTVLSLVLVGGALFGQFLPVNIRGYLPAMATQAVVTVHRSAGILRPIPALAVLAGYAAITFLAASVRIGRRDA